MRSLAVLVLTLALAGCGDAAEDARLERSRALAAAFQQQLGGELQAALGRGGPAEAIRVCRDVAPEIAARFSAESGARVSRTALRVRNPGNAPDDHAAAVLREFAGATAQRDGPPERFDVAADGSARYLRAIILQPMCAACHGTELAPEAVPVLAELYPDDQATGFAVGELRGAFLIDWPAPAT